MKQQGAGRVAVVLSDTLWRWRVASPEWTGRQSAYDTFWGQLLDWMAPDQEGLPGGGRIELTTERPFYHQGDQIAVLAEWIGKGPTPFNPPGFTVRNPVGTSQALIAQPAVWRNPDGRRITGFRAEMNAGTTGIYEVEAHASWQGGEARADTRIAVAAAPEERRSEAPDAVTLREISRQSGGDYFARGEGDKWLRHLPQAKRQTQREVVTDIWNHPLVAILLMGSLCAEWWLRRRRGRV